MAKSKLKRGQKIRWTSKGPKGKKRREGIVRGFVPAGSEVKFPKAADLNKFKAEMVNVIHNRYLVEIERVHKRTGKKLPSQWLAPKAAILDKKAKEI